MLVTAAPMAVEEAAAHSFAFVFVLVRVVVATGMSCQAATSQAAEVAAQPLLKVAGVEEEEEEEEEGAQRARLPPSSLLRQLLRQSQLFAALVFFSPLPRVCQ